MSKPQPGCGPEGPDSATRAEDPEEELSTDERRISLRVKVPAEDGTAVVEMTGPAVPENGLQAFGDWVLAALEQHADGAAEAARLMIAALRERDWDGDDVLADQFDTLLGSSTSLRPLPVDLDELAGILEGDPMYGGGRVDLATGEVWPAPAVDYAREIGQEDEDESDDPDKWLWVHCEGSRDSYRDMELFIGTVRDPGRADRLEIAISGRGAFRRSPRGGPDRRLQAAQSGATAAQRCRQDRDPDPASSSPQRRAVLLLAVTESDVTGAGLRKLTAGPGIEPGWTKKTPFTDIHPQASALPRHRRVFGAAAAAH